VKLDVAALGASLFARAKQGLRRHAFRLALGGVLGFLSFGAVLRATGGEAAVPLDDAFIHFQYARSLWEGRGFSYTPGAAPAAGATSLFWPLALALPYGFGLRGELVIYAAWLFGWAALVALGYETRRAAERLLSDDGALAAELMVVTFGGYVWFATSGMEVVPLAWVLMRTARRSAEWAEAEFSARPKPWELLAYAGLGPLVRPEGAIATLSVAATLALGARGKQRLFGLGALAFVAVPALVNRALTGTSTTTTALVKWLPLNPYVTDAALAKTIGDNVKLLFGTLLNGEIWSAVFLPQGASVFLWLALPALAIVAFRTRAWWRAALIFAVALGMFVPTTYDSFLWNRLRYLWPFMAAWLVGVAALGDLVGALAARFGRSERVRLLVSGLAVGGLVSRLGWTLEDLATSSNAIRLQQASLGRWASDSLPKDALIGVNDTGAIAYFSNRRTFDVCGLTTAGEARYWVAGAGSRFEHYERLGAGRLPTHFVVYTNWFAIPTLLGEYRTQRSVPGATILGGETMVAHVASYRALGSGALPRLARPCRVLDELDVADLESEAAHGYELFGATSATNLVVEQGDAADGGRNERVRERFAMTLVPNGRFVARVEARAPVALEVFVEPESGGAATSLGRRELWNGEWQEVAWTTPPNSQKGRVTIDLRVHGGTVTALHYWSLEECAEP
jgi:hypothetical protein